LVESHIRANEEGDKHDNQMHNFYETEVYKDFDPTAKPRLWQIFALKVLLEERLEGKVILDVGSGPGFILRKLKPKNPVLHALDLSTKCVSYLNQQGIKAIRLDISSDAFPYENNFFDYVIFTEVIEHLAFPDHTIQEIYRVLKPGGKLLISTHNPFNLYMRLRYLAGVFPTPELDVSRRGQHIRMFNYETLTKVLESAGFRLFVNRSWFSFLQINFFVPNLLTPMLSRHLLLLCIKTK
jgi:2-polyprenyl-3-methyl-5-hydroxy-6-metoxy-1,4-benzoquinol methylase